MDPDELVPVALALALLDELAVVDEPSEGEFEQPTIAATAAMLATLRSVATLSISPPYIGNGAKTHFVTTTVAGLFATRLVLARKAAFGRETSSNR